MPCSKRMGKPLYKQLFVGSVTQGARFGFLQICLGERNSSPKNENEVAYSSLWHSKPLWLTFFYGIQKKLPRISACLLHKAIVRHQKTDNIVHKSYGPLIWSFYSAFLSILELDSPLPLCDSTVINITQVFNNMWVNDVESQVLN